MITGKVLKPQGIRGELKIEPLVSNLEVFHDFKNVLIDGKTYTVKSVRIHESFVYLSLKELKDRNDAETLRGKEIEVLKQQMPNLLEDQFFIVDLEGCSVFFEDGEKLGKVKEVQNFGASDILVIKDGTEEVLCPFLKKVFFDVDIKNKKIIANKKNFLEVTRSED